MASKKSHTDPEATQTDDTRDSLIAEVVELTRKVDAFTADIRREFASTKTLVGRLEDRCNALHERHNETHSEWAQTREEWKKFRSEVASGAQVSGAAARKALDRVEVLEKNMSHLTDPHAVTRPLKVEVAKVADGMVALKKTVERRLTEFREEIESKVPALVHQGRGTRS